MLINNPLISVIIPTFNRARLIAETLESVLNQTYTNWECIVVDDGSNDNTVQVVEGFQSKDARFQCFSRPLNLLKGANTCRNFGLSKARGAYINFFDSDDLMIETKMELDIADLLNSHKDFTISQSVFFDPKSMQKLKNWNDNLYSDFPLDDFITKRIGWGINSPLWVRDTLIKNDIYFNVGLKNGQDYSFHIEAIRKGLKPIVRNQALVLIRSHANKIENEIKKAPSKAQINLSLLKFKKTLRPDTTDFLEQQALIILSSLYKHKYWSLAITYSFGLAKASFKSRILFEAFRLFSFGTFYRLFGVGYKFLKVARKKRSIKS